MTNLMQTFVWLCCVVVLAGCNDSMKPIEQAPPAASADIANVEQVKEPSPIGEPAAPPSAAAPAAATALAADEPQPAAQGASPIDQCPRICAKSTELKCQRAAECEAMCKESMVLPACQREMVAANECMLAQPIAKWACTPEGLAAITSGCEAAQEKFVACLSAM